MAATPKPIRKQHKKIAKGNREMFQEKGHPEANQFTKKEWVKNAKKSGAKKHDLNTLKSFF